jgi:hypothetical protein
LANSVGSGVKTHFQQSLGRHVRRQAHSSLVAQASALPCACHISNTTTPKLKMSTWGHSRYSSVQILSSTTGVHMFSWDYCMCKGGRKAGSTI